jgi:hypothetical protein
MVNIDIKGLLEHIKQKGISWEMTQDTIRFVKPHTTAVTTISELVECVENYIKIHYVTEERKPIKEDDSKCGL